MDLTCAACGAPLSEDDRFCEQCGARVGDDRPVSPAAPAPAGADAVMRAPETAGCWSCGAPAEAIGEDGYCSQCGMRQRPPHERDELDLELAAAVTDQGKVHHRNEDAFALQVLDERRVAAVVCDGISTASASNAAARAAADAAAAVLADGLADTARDGEEITKAAIAAANDAVVRVEWTTRADRVDPSCTLVSALCRGDEIVIGWAGDSRVYWLEAGEVTQLTADDSWAKQQIEAGLPPEQAFKAPFAHAITNWVGPDAPMQEPGIVVIHPEQAGRLLLCTDGLWNYAPTPPELAALLEGLPAGSGPAAVARSLTDAALDRGGRDNITVVVVECNPSQGG
jgi:serine/threonine protein phosphatase PrpC